MIINLVYDAQAQAEIAAHPEFQTTMEAAADELEDHISNAITVNIQVGFGEINGNPLPSANVSEGNIWTFPTVSYSDLRNALQTAGSAGSGTLPSGSSIEGQSSFTIGTAQEKALGLGGIDPNASGLDGVVGMGSGFGTGSVLFAGALHELTHAMGRIAGDTVDLYRFNEDGSDTRVFGGAIPATGAYFSIDGGATELADFGISSDPGDFLNGGVQGTDPFNETVGVTGLTSVDLTIMNALGFNTVNNPPTVTALTDSVDEDGPYSKDLLTGASDPEDDAISVANLDGSVTTSGGRTLALGTDYTLSGSTLALTASGLSQFDSLSQGRPTPPYSTTTSRMRWAQVPVTRSL